MTKHYDDYDYEEAYEKQLKELEEYEQERHQKEKQRNICYRTTTTKCGPERVEVDIYPSFGSRQDMPRTRRGRESRAAQKNLNEKRARRYLIQLACTNFGKDDYWCTFTYDKEHLPATIDGCQREFSNFMKRVNRRRKKKGLPNAKYIVITEHTENTRAHHHVLIDGGLTRDELEDLWKCGGRNNLRRISPDEDFQIEGIGRYIGKQKKTAKKRWSRSKGNLKEPEVTRSYSRFSKRKVERMARDEEFLQEQIRKQYPGCKLLDTDIRVNDVNGGFYIYARLRRY